MRRRCGPVWELTEPLVVDGEGGEVNRSLCCSEIGDPVGFFEEETLKLNWGPEERGEDQLRRGNCKCKDTDTQNIMASSGNHSGLILVERMLAGD